MADNTCFWNVVSPRASKTETSCLFFGLDLSDPLFGVNIKNNRHYFPLQGRLVFLKRVYFQCSQNSLIACTCLSLSMEDI